MAEATIMSYVYMGDIGQSQQDAFWSWFMTGSGPKPKKAYKEASFKQQQAGQAPTANKAWGGMAYEAEADEDLDPFKAQGYDAAQALGRLGQVDQWGMADEPAPAPVVPSAPVVKSKAPMILAGSLAVGGVVALIYGAVTAKAPEPKERAEARRRKGEMLYGVRANARPTRKN